jgi:hypothetical protein
MRQYKEGDEVIISRNLRGSQTDSRFRVVSGMHDMEGKIYKINTVGGNNSVTIYSDDKGRSYRFDITDISPYQLDTTKIFLKEKKKHIFDPELLYL